MFTEKSKTGERREFRRGPGRPRGRTAQGDATRRQLYRVALRLIARKGYAETSLRDVARAARVSPGLLYKYFPSKRDLVLTLHAQLSADYARRVRHSAKRLWIDRVVAAVEVSIDTLRPHRDALVALIPVLVSNDGDGVLSPERASSRRLVQDAFVAAIGEADDAPDPAMAEALGRLFYIAHLVVLLLWLLDKSSRQRATGRLLAAIDQRKSWIALALTLPQMRPLVEAADALVREGLLCE
jgi:AcrR family transcriptional regulator